MNSTSKVSCVILLIIVSFILSLIKYSVALKRLINRRLVAFAEKKRNLDVITCTSFIILFFLSKGLPEYNVVWVGIMILEILGFIIYSSLKKDFFT